MESSRRLDAVLDVGRNEVEIAAAQHLRLVADEDLEAPPGFDIGYLEVRMPVQGSNRAPAKFHIDRHQLVGIGRDFAANAVTDDSQASLADSMKSCSLATFMMKGSVA